MVYFIFLIIFLFVIYGLSLFVKITTSQNVIFDFFIRQLTVLSVIISLFAVLITKGKTVFLVFIFAFIYLLFKKKLSFKLPKEINKSNFKFFLLIIPIISIQFLLQFDISSLTPYIPSSDITQYASYAWSMVEFGSENKYETLNKLYPHLFSGIGPYHYYEIWFTSVLGFLSKESYVFILQLIVYPYLIWLFILGIASVFEEYYSKVSLKHYFLCFLLLFIGPVYFSVYQFVFNDGDFLTSTVFTVPGFVKQTLCFSYFGQKHLPVYIFGILSFLFLIKKQYSNFILSGLLISICSFGTLPGVFGALGVLYLIKRELRTKSNFIIFCLIGLTFIVIIGLFKLNINHEISQKTFYYNDFLKYLNFKGEIVRFTTKLIVPFIWFLVLYLPYVGLIFIYRNSIFNTKELKWLYLLSGFFFIFGALFITMVQGLNSDQFITNLMPLFNVIIIITLIHLFYNLKSKILFSIVVLLTVVINTIFIINYFSSNVNKQDKLFDLAVVKSVKSELKSNKSKPIIAYLLSEKDINERPPVNWYGVKPGKMFTLDNYFNLININYPYMKYLRNTSSIAFSPDNQMRYFLHYKMVSPMSMGKYQVEFLLKNNIKWIFCTDSLSLPKVITPFISKTFFDSISGEIYYKLK